MRTREEAIRYVLEKHGPTAVYIASTGYLARAVHEVAAGEYEAFYMQGSMGLAPAIGLGMALNTTRDVVVMNGDASLLMALGTTHTLRDRAPTNLFHYVFDNGVHESVGGQASARLEAGYPGVTEIIEVSLGSKPPRVAVSPDDNARSIRDALTEAPRR
jgi:phosphonopyruvate decarboxylase